MNSVYQSMRVRRPGDSQLFPDFRLTSLLYFVAGETITSEGQKVRFSSLAPDPSSTLVRSGT